MCGQKTEEKEPLERKILKLLERADMDNSRVVERK